MDPTPSGDLNSHFYYFDLNIHNVFKEADLSFVFRGYSSGRQ